jgi:hypothetical protein
MRFDAIDVLGALGYSDREATFLYLTAIHSGYFLRRQFSDFVQRERGGVVSNLLRKAIQRRHVAVLPCSDGRYIYHLHSKTVYRLLEQAESQNRRMKSPPEILRRLISFDYILQRFRHETFIESREAMRQLFSKLKIELNPNSFQHVLVSFRGDGPQLTVRFTFVDEGQRSTARFARFLELDGKRIRAIERAELTYIATTPRNFPEVERLFQRHMPLRTLASPACPRGVEHLIEWLQIRHKFHAERSSITPTEHRVLLEGENLYRAPVHLGLIASWSNGSTDPDKIRKHFHADSHRVVFETGLLKLNYPGLIQPGVGAKQGALAQGKPAQKPLFPNNMDDFENPG